MGLSVSHKDAIRHLAVEVHELNGRIDNVLIGPMGQQVRDHESRIRRLEERASLGEE